MCWAAPPAWSPRCSSLLGCGVCTCPGWRSTGRGGPPGAGRTRATHDARVITDQVRMREDLRVIDASAEIDVDLRLWTGRRQELVCDQTRRANRLRDLLGAIHPGLEQRVDVTAKSDPRPGGCPADSCSAVASATVTAWCGI